MAKTIKSITGRTIIIGDVDDDGDQEILSYPHNSDRAHCIILDAENRKALRKALKAALA